jgi:hypothetical protein
MAFVVTSFQWGAIAPTALNPGVPSDDSFALQRLNGLQTSLDPGLLVRQEALLMRQTQELMVMLLNLMQSSKQQSSHNAVAVQQDHPDPVANAAPHTQAPVPAGGSGAVLDQNLKANLDSYQPGAWGGQCCAFVEKVFGLLPKNKEFGMNAGGNGGVTAPCLIQNFGFKPVDKNGTIPPGAVFSGNFEGGKGPGHTGIVLRDEGNGMLLVEDSNWGGDEKVRIHTIRKAACSSFAVKS